ncbi:MAG: FAD-binding oxidoreductase [Bryobacteraceae bacterium]
METADVVIIGAGIVGASIAFHLTETGCNNVLMIERETQQGKGSTGKSMGGVRAQFATPESIRMSLYSIPVFRDFESIVGGPSGYRAQGYLFVATSDRQLTYLRTNHERQASLGLKDAAILRPDDVMRLIPQLRADDIVGGSFCATDGFVDPYSVMMGFTARAVERGARLWRGVTVTGIRVDAKGVAGVETTNGFAASRAVVNAAGAWAGAVARLAGVELPVEPLRRMLLPTEPFDKIAHSAPMTVDLATGFHFRPEGLGLLMAWHDPHDVYGFNTDFDPAFVEKVLTRAVSRVPCLETAEVNPRRGWAGLYEMTPDHHPVLGEAPEVRGLWLANGFSGHGVMHSPAAGHILAGLILKGSSDLIDTRTFSLSRFAEGRLIEETAIL